MGPVLCLITDRHRWGANWPQVLPEQVSAAARAGVHLVQVREADLEGSPLRDLVLACMSAVRGTRTRVVVNDRVDVALAAGAHGVHLRGQSPATLRVRGWCPRPFLIGRSIHSAEEAAREGAAELDYLVFGTVFASTSKPGRAPAGIEPLAAAVAATPVPVLAVGGVTLARVPAVMQAGAAGVAGIGLFAGDVAAAAAALGGWSGPIDTPFARSLP